METKIVIKLAMPSADDNKKKTKEEACPRPSIEDEVKDAIELIESGHDSQVEWRMISRVYKELCAMKKQTPRIKNLKKMIEPVLAKYGYHGVDAGA